jgi:hypothetical protein
MDMPRFKEIAFHRAATVNLGNFNSTKVEVLATVEVQEGEDPEAVFERLTQWVNTKVKEQIRNGA